jgi:hypothetical protein
MAAVGNFVPEIVPGNDGTLETLAPQGHTPVKPLLAETVAKVGVAGSNPIVRSQDPRSGPRKGPHTASIRHNSPDTGHKSRWDWRVQIGIASHVVGLESPFVPPAFVLQA